MRYERKTNWALELRNAILSTLNYFLQKGITMGLIVSLSDTHFIKSNKESGDGRYDVLLIPKDPQKLGLVLEFKVAENDNSLEKTAQQALAQINQLHYATELQQQGIHNILKVGLAFRGKEVAMVSS